MQKLSISTKLLLPIVAIYILSLSSVIAINIYASEKRIEAQTKQSIEMMEREAKVEAANIEKFLNKAMNISRTLATTFSVLNDNGEKNRAVYAEILKEVTKKNSEYVNG